MIYRTQTHIAFGHGDIDIMIGFESGKGYLAFKNLAKPRPIGSQPVKKKRRFMDINAQDLIMSFTDPESIDALLQCLETIRDRAFNESEEESDA